MIDISIIIAHREVNSFDCKSCDTKISNTSAAQPLGLWTTIHSIDMDLQDTNFTYDYRIQTNGSDKLHPDSYTTIEYIRQCKKLGYHNHSIESISPPSARHLATIDSNAKYLFFFDNHIIVKPGYFKRAIESMQKYDMDMLHSTTGFFIGQPLVYHYTSALEKNFWGVGTHGVMKTEPYRIAVAGHGGFIVKTDVYRQVGGYWNGFVGYGGEECYFDLKMALLNKTNWLDPQLIHYHYAGNRGYPRHYTDDFYVNILSCANIIGGQTWINKVYPSLANKYSKIDTGKTMFDLMDIAQAKSKDHSSWLDTQRSRTLDEQLNYFKDNAIEF